MTPTTTDRIPKQFRFEQPKLPPVVVNFQGGAVTSDAGLSLIAEIDQKLQITSRLAQCFQDYGVDLAKLSPGAISPESIAAQRL